MSITGQFPPSLPPPPRRGKPPAKKELDDIPKLLPPIKIPSKKPKLTRNVKKFLGPSTKENKKYKKTYNITIIVLTIIGVLFMASGRICGFLPFVLKIAHLDPNSLKYIKIILHSVDLGLSCTGGAFWLTSFIVYSAKTMETT